MLASPIKRLALSLAVYAVLMAAVVVLVRATPARSEEGTKVWSPRLHLPVGNLIRPQALGAFTSEQACKDWTKTEEAQAEFTLVLANSPFDLSDISEIDCIERPVETSTGDPA